MTYPSSVGQDGAFACPGNACFPWLAGVGNRQREDRIGIAIVPARRITPNNEGKVWARMLAV